MGIGSSNFYSQHLSAHLTLLAATMIHFLDFLVCIVQCRHVSIHRSSDMASWAGSRVVEELYICIRLLRSLRSWMLHLASMPFGLSGVRSLVHHYVWHPVPDYKSSDEHARSGRPISWPEQAHVALTFQLPSALAISSNMAHRILQASLNGMLQ